MAARSAHTRNTSGLVASAKAKSSAKRERVVQVIQELVDAGKTVNFNAVAQSAGCTKSYLYAQADLRERIDVLRQRQGQARLTLVYGAVREQGRTDKSKDVIIAAKDAMIAAQAKRIQGLEAEITRLKAENKKLYGEMYEKL